MKNAEIDWSKAPEWATVRLQHTHDSRMFAWAERYQSDVRFMRDDTAPEVYPQLAPDAWVVLAERPQQWNGEGLPPVGTVCLTEHEGEEFSVEILAYGKHGYDDAVLVARRIGNSPGVMHGWIANQCGFRPVRTPEQVAAEQRRKMVAVILNDAGVTGSAFADDPEAAEWASALLDAGYRKTKTCDPVESDK